MMEDNVFIFFHGSSVGQTSYVPADAPAGLCEAISNSYFAGRASRLEQSKADMALFVELRKHEDESYVCYSYVKNKCISSEGRTGQYLAITCMSKDAYYLPDQMLSLLKAVYNQMFVGSIIDEKGVWLVSGLRGSEAVPALERAIKTIREWVVGQNRKYYPYKRLESSMSLKFVGYQDWSGRQFAIDTCNSYGAFKALCNDGRIYVSEEYQSESNAAITKLEAQIAGLKSKNDDLERENRGFKDNRGKGTPTHAPAGEREKVLENKNYELSSRNQMLENEINYIRHEKKKLILLRNILLPLLLIVSVINFIPRNGGKKETSGGNGSGGNIDSTYVVPQEEPTKQELTLFLSESSLNYEASGDKKEIKVTTNGNLTIPASPKTPEWVKIEITNDSVLSVEVIKNENKERSAIITLTAQLDDQSKEETISIEQEGKKREAQFIVEVRRSNAEANLKEGELLTQNGKCNDNVTVKKDDVLYLKYTGRSATGNEEWSITGCKYCNGSSKNQGAVFVKVTNDTGGVNVSFGSNRDNRKQVTIPIEQEIQLTVSPNEIKVDETKQEKEITVTVNGMGNWSWAIPAGASRPSWIEIKKKSDSSDKLQIIIQENTSAIERSFSFNITAGNKSEKVTITQSAIQPEVPKEEPGTITDN